MKSPVTAKRLALALSNANMRPQDLANASGVNKASISQYLSGAHAPSNISSGKMAKILDVSPLWLMGFDVPMKERSESSRPKNKGVMIPVLGDVAAGIPIEAQENILDWEEISEDMAKHGEYFCLRVKGNSMSPYIENGDIVVVRCQSDVESGEIAIVKVNGDSATCKRLKKYADHISLISINSEYDPMFFSEKEIQTIPVSVIGKVVELRRKL